MKILLDADELRQGVERMARFVQSTYADRPLTIIGVLTGSVVLLADLIRRLEMPLSVAVVQARSYRQLATMPGPLSLNTDMLPDLRGKNVLLLDDIFDTGHTLFRLVAQLHELGPTSLRTAVLLRKADRCQVEFQPDFTAFEIENLFVVGYGLDFCDAYRNLPYLAALEEHEFAAGGSP